MTMRKVLRPLVTGISVSGFLIFVKYSVVGVVGTTVDVLSLFVLVDLLHVPVLAAAAVSFTLAVINNFVLNKVWTFRNSSRNTRKQFIKFFIVSMVGLGLTELFMAIFVLFLGIWYIAAKLATSVIVLTWNFLANKNWTFTEKGRAAEFPDQYAYEVTVIIPALNEEKRIGTTIEAVHRHFASRNMKREIIVVDDGSRDNTSGVVTELAKSVPDLRLFSYQPNRGKGHAVRTGVEESRGRYILFADADNSTPIEEFDRLYPFLAREEVVIGSRYLAESQIKIRQSLSRVLIGRLGNGLIQVLLFDNVKDTQCGFKAFQHRAAREIFSRMKVNRFGFDIELLAIASLLKYSVHEVPVSWYNSPLSRVRPVKDALRTFFELLYIKFNLMSGRYSRDEEGKNGKAVKEGEPSASLVSSQRGSGTD